MSKSRKLVGKSPLFENMEGDAENFEIPETKLSVENAGKRCSYRNRTLKLMGLSSQVKT